MKLKEIYLIVLDKEYRLFDSRETQKQNPNDRVEETSAHSAKFTTLNSHKATFEKEMDKKHLETEDWSTKIQENPYFQKLVENRKKEKGRRGRDIHSDFCWGLNPDEGSTPSPVS